MQQVFLSIGSNLKDPIKNVQKALQEIELLKDIFDFKKSSLYHTKPMYIVDQPEYINTACSFFTSLEVFELFSILCEIEKKIGKVDKPKNFPRIVDIDMLLYGKLISNNPKLILPHPLMLERLFVLEPLKELAESIEINNQNINLDQLITKLKKSSNMLCK